MTHSSRLLFCLVGSVVLCAVASCGGDDDSADPGGDGGWTSDAGLDGSAGSDGSGADGAAGVSFDGAAGSSGSGDDASVEAEASACSAATCTQPGFACVEGACVADCRRPNAVPCAQGTVCDVGSEHTGLCTQPGTGCVIAGEADQCAQDDAGVALVCGPGTLCNGKGGCYAALPCRDFQCDSAGCWGVDCSCTRPAATCSPAPLGAPGEAGTLNDYAFTRGGDGGIFDLDFDQKCNAWAVTMISGPDYLRSISPQGTVTSFTGVTNLNMGEVAAIQGKEGSFGGGLMDVALTYVCCQACGCVLSGSGGNPQGVAYLDSATSTLPMKIPTVQFSQGAGPFGNASVDTGPYGLSWGLDRVLYAGNVDANGDFQALDLETSTKQIITTFGARVHASAPFDRMRMIVALEGGEVDLVPILGASGSPQKLVDLGAHVTSVVRDRWSGRLYAELSDLRIVSFAADGSGVETFQTAPAKGRIAIAPDGYLYHLTVGWPTEATIVRWELPTTL